ncbi:uncharacterized protein BXIN_0520 [Babesia sp. Xinjiang]|uniref:uncharacterized protein n=1 Tax=Babesia sp. Xinjiang TaxID=462227 RepID=UPI000A24D35E|nr:uncharacterized protein BXIN_0520 [Babesia sp. Xinjiang]ORM41899.1 hypothetical protein BXIN_0520 [Babesia sp. Xinjiang]
MAIFYRSRAWGTLLCLCFTVWNGLLFPLTNAVIVQVGDGKSTAMLLNGDRNAVAKKLFKLYDLITRAESMRQDLLTKCKEQEENKGSDVEKEGVDILASFTNDFQKLSQDSQMYREMTELLRSHEAGELHLLRKDITAEEREQDEASLARLAEDFARKQFVFGEQHIDQLITQYTTLLHEFGGFLRVDGSSNTSQNISWNEHGDDGEAPANTETKSDAAGPSTGSDSGDNGASSYSNLEIPLNLDRDECASQGDSFFTVADVISLSTGSESNGNGASSYSNLDIPLNLDGDECISQNDASATGGDVVSLSTGSEEGESESVSPSAEPQVPPEAKLVEAMDEKIMAVEAELSAKEREVAEITARRDEISSNAGQIALALSEFAARRDEFFEAENRLQMAVAHLDSVKAVSESELEAKRKEIEDAEITEREATATADEVKARYRRELDSKKKDFKTAERKGEALAKNLETVKVDADARLSAKKRELDLADKKAKDAMKRLNEIQDNLDSEKQEEQNAISEAEAMLTGPDAEMAIERAKAELDEKQTELAAADGRLRRSIEDLNRIKSEIEAAKQAKQKKTEEVEAKVKAADTDELKARATAELEDTKKELAGFEQQLESLIKEAKKALEVAQAEFDATEKEHSEADVKFKESLKNAELRRRIKVELEKKREDFSASERRRDGLINDAAKMAETAQAEFATKQHEYEQLKKSTDETVKRTEHMKEQAESELAAKTQELNGIKSVAHAAVASANKVKEDARAACAAKRKEYDQLNRTTAEAINEAERLKADAEANLVEKIEELDRIARPEAYEYDEAEPIDPQAALPPMRVAYENALGRITEAVKSAEQQKLSYESEILTKLKEIDELRTQVQVTSENTRLLSERVDAIALATMDNRSPATSTSGRENIASPRVSPEEVFNKCSAASVTLFDATRLVKEVQRILIVLLSKTKKLGFRKHPKASEFEEKTDAVMILVGGLNNKYAVYEGMRKLCSDYDLWWQKLNATTDEAEKKQHLARIKNLNQTFRDQNYYSYMMELDSYFQLCKEAYGECEKLDMELNVAAEEQIENPVTSATDDRITMAPATNVELSRELNPNNDGANVVPRGTTGRTAEAGVNPNNDGANVVPSGTTGRTAEAGVNPNNDAANVVRSRGIQKPWEATVTPRDREIENEADVVEASRKTTVEAMRSKKIRAAPFVRIKSGYAVFGFLTVNVFALLQFMAFI